MFTVKNNICLIVILAFASISPASASTDTSFIKDLILNKTLMTPAGDLSETSLAKVLAQAFAEKKISDANFKAAGCLEVKNIPVVGSFNTRQLFRIKSTCAGPSPVFYIAKEARDGEGEAVSLRAIEIFPGMKELLAPKAPPKDSLSMALPLFYLSYKDQDNAQRYLALMPLAPGRVLCDFVKEYRDKPTAQNADRLETAYKTLGLQLGNFHKRNMKPVAQAAIGKTVLHGDLHCLNIFYDEPRGLFTLIDNETMKSFLVNPATPDDDILKLFLGLSSQSEPEERKDMIKGIDLKTWYDLAFASFAEGYAQAYPQAQQKQVYQDLEKIFTVRSKPSWLTITAAALRELRDKYINPILKKKST